MAKAKKIPYLNPFASITDSLPRILKTRFNEMLSYEKAVIETSDIEKIHDMRVASRRLQSVLKLFRDGLPKNGFLKQYQNTKIMKDFLGDVRHFDVFIEMLEKYNKTLTGKEKKVFNLVIIRQKALRERHRKALIQKIKNLNRVNYKESFLNYIGII